MSTKTQSKSQLAYSWIKERISDRRFSPGYRLVLGTIAGELGMSAVPVREAIRQLEAEGLVTFETNVGAHVSMLHESEYFTTMQTLSIVEGAATRLSAPHVSPDDIARARAINDQMRQSAEHVDPHRLTQLNRRFHAVLFEHCPNVHILDLVHRGWARLDALRDSIFSFVPDRAMQSVREHEELLRLIETGAEPMEIELAARAHRERTVDAFLAHQNAQKPA